MSIINKHFIPDKNYSVDDFYKKGVVLTSVNKSYHYQTNKPKIRITFRSNGLLGLIRTTCYGDTYAVDVRWGWWTNEDTCITTECKSLREAKSVLYMWFKSKGFVKSNEELKTNWSWNTMKLPNIQLNLNPIIFR